MGYAVSVPSSLVLLVSGLALLGVGVLMREWKRKWRLWHRSPARGMLGSRIRRTTTSWTPTP